MTVTYLFGGLAAFSIVHFVSILARKEKFQAASKVTLLPLVLAVYLASTNHVLIPVLLALFFGWLGDIFLIKIEAPVFFKCGLASFLLGHIFYIVSMMHYTNGIHRIALVTGITLSICLGFLLYKVIRPGKEMIVPVIAYEIVILLMLNSAFQLFLANGSRYGALILAGGLCFVVSDFMLAFFTFRAKLRYGDLPVMLTYISAQLCIVLGLSGM
ncbi:MAG: lysoplasmalogenase [Treponema sp.]|jgi:uncharacterized membrane protein YhhN|nr:lysoplasmalogenase [Treponema sp.]